MDKKGKPLGLVEQMSKESLFSKKSKGSLVEQASKESLFSNHNRSNRSNEKTKIEESDESSTTKKITWTDDIAKEEMKKQ